MGKPDVFNPKLGISFPLLLGPKVSEVFFFLFSFNIKCSFNFEISLSSFVELSKPNFCNAFENFFLSLLTLSFLIGIDALLVSIAKLGSACSKCTGFSPKPNLLSIASNLDLDPNS